MACEQRSTLPFPSQTKSLSFFRRLFEARVFDLDITSDLYTVVHIMPRWPVFKELTSDTPHLALARLPDCAQRLLAHADFQGGLALTPGGALKRVHVDWAAEDFNWPGHTPHELYRYNKVLNEEDVFPLWVLHRHLLHTRHARHYGKMFRTTNTGRSLIGAPHRAFNEIVPRFLFEVDHGAMSRGGLAIVGHLVDYLDALNLVAGDWIGIDALTERILGPASKQVWDRRPLSLYVGVIRPLIWCGLLLEVDADADAFETNVMKSPLWHHAFALPSDDVLGLQRGLK